MKFRLNRAFSLLEVLITVAVLSTAIIFVLRSFTAALSAARFSQNIGLACYLAENKLWEIEQKQKLYYEPLIPEQGSQILQERRFNWAYTLSKLTDADLILLKVKVSWQEKAREKEYSLSFSTYLLPKQP